MSKYKVQVGQERFEVQVEDVTAHPVIVTIDDQRFEVWIQEQEAPEQGQNQLLRTPPPHQVPDPLAIAAQPRRQPMGGKTLRAPMPGQILEIRVAAGDQVERGEILCVLEAMKMNNQIRATRIGVVAEVLTSAGSQVNYGDPLIRFE
jgi:biotin carboxyl carrier protein